MAGFRPYVLCAIGLDRFANHELWWTEICYSDNLHALGLHRPDDKPEWVYETYKSLLEYGGEEGKKAVSDFRASLIQQGRTSDNDARMKAFELGKPSILAHF